MTQINLKWCDFSLPSAEKIKEFTVKYPTFNDAKLVEIKSRYKIYEVGDRSLKTNYLYNEGNELKYISEINNIIGVIDFNLKHLWFYTSLEPNRFKAGTNSAASIYYETFYEVVYSKLSSSFDRFLQLVNVYYELKLQPKDVKESKIKESIIEMYNNDILLKNFNDLLEEKTLSKISNIRNSFIHRESLFDKYLGINNNIYYDKFQYKNKTKDAIDHYIWLVNFLNKKAIPFLYKFQDFKKVK